MKKSIFMYGLFVFLLFGCVQTANVIPSMAYSDKRDSFKLGEIQEKTVGDVMLFRIDGTGHKGFIASTTYSPPDYKASTMITPTIQSASEWMIIGKLDNGGYLLRQRPPLMKHTGKGSWEICLIINSRYDPYADTTCNLNHVVVWEWSETAKNLLIPKEGLIYKEGSLRQELIYSGKSKDSIKLKYREFKDDFAREAFYQELSYDLSESKTISFRDMIIEVIEANNSSIKFIVKKGLN